MMEKVLTCVDMMDMVFTCVDMVSNVVTPKATLAGTDRLSSQKETWWIFYVYLDTPKNIPLSTAYLLWPLLTHETITSMQEGT